MIQEISGINVFLLKTNKYFARVKFEFIRMQKIIKELAFNDDSPIPKIKLMIDEILELQRLLHGIYRLAKDKSIFHIYQQPF